MNLTKNFNLIFFSCIKRSLRKQGRQPSKCRGASQLSWDAVINDMAKNFLFTSESVCKGHPDKIADSISDSILDEVLRQDKFGKVAVETLVTKGQVFLAGEISANAKVDYKKVARKRIADLGYTNPDFGFFDKSKINVYIHEQSPEIAKGVRKRGAGDQGMMFGYAAEETAELMPLPISVAHTLAKELDNLKDEHEFLRPDGKTQITIEYKNDKPYRATQVVIAVPHDEDISSIELKNILYKELICQTLERFKLKISQKDFILNGTGIWHMPGPASDTGLTGRKIIVDTYGGSARVGGGCFSGKDPTKVDRSGAYAARFIAKHIVKEGLASKAEVRLAYFIGAKTPTMQDVETFGTEKVKRSVILDFMKKTLDTSVEGIIESLNLRQPIYLPTSTYGHFGHPNYPWEK